MVLKSLEENVVYFKSPSDIQFLNEVKNKKIRVGGMVKINSIKISSTEVNFIITDFKNEIKKTKIMPSHTTQNCETILVKILKLVKGSKVCPP